MSNRTNKTQDSQSKGSFMSRLAKPRRRKLWTIVFWSLISLPFVTILSLIFLIQTSCFGKLPTFEELENPRSNLSTEVISAEGKNLGSYFIENRSFVQYDELSPYLVQALVSTEDSRFYTHSGIDFIGLTRVAFKTVLLGQKQGGGSTISQQLAKNLYPRDTVSRGAVAKMGMMVVSKLKEWVTGVMLEHNYTKEEIITMYLNTVAYGSNSFGIKSASQTFFNKEPKDLNPEEAAVLIGVVNAPTLYSPVSNPKNSVRRRNVVLSRMQQAGFLSPKQLDTLAKRAIKLNYSPISHNKGVATYFREMVRLYMTADEPVKKKKYQTEWDFETEKTLWKTDPLYGWCNKNTKANGEPYNLYRDGLKIYTTLNYTLQEYAEEAVFEQMSEVVQPAFDRQRKANGGKILYDVNSRMYKSIMKRIVTQTDRYRALKKTGVSESAIQKDFDRKRNMQVFSYKGMVDTVLSPRDSLLHYKAHLRAAFAAMEPTSGHLQAYVGGVDFRHFKYDMASQGRRQVGSTIKPFVYTFAIDHLGYTPCTPVPNTRVTIELGNGEVWSPKEAGKVDYDGEPRFLKWGLANSRNNYSAWIMKQSSPNAVAQMIHKMGVNSRIEPVYSLCVGAAEVTLMEMIGAFSTFVNRGVYTRPIFVTRIEDKQGNTLSSFSPATRDAISEQTAYTMVNMLKNNINAGTGGRLKYAYGTFGEVGGKTGTTNNNADAWFMAVTPKIVAGAWVGGEEQPTHLTRSGYGSVLSLPIFGKFMQKVYADPKTGITTNDRFLEPVGAINYDCTKESLGTTQTDEAQREEEFFE